MRGSGVRAIDPDSGVRRRAIRFDETGLLSAGRNGTYRTQYQYSQSNRSIVDHSVHSSLLFCSSAASQSPTFVSFALLAVPGKSGCAGAGTFFWTGSPALSVARIADQMVVF